PGVPLEVCFEAGYVFLNADAASNLQAGDVLMPDTWTPPATIRALFWQGSSACKIMECSFSEGKATISTCLTESDDMENIANELEIRLSFELERRMISIADLETLSPGYVFDLECDAQSPVTVRANGKPIALGRIVDINGTIGVQLTQKL
ncbi:MAG: FliM/FliN family flagellar motor switch protein, partial [Mailhella sp.]|nr:FliM/FliN family flagellar motor switch protein [Mailhella sp.]